MEEQKKVLAKVSPEAAQKIRQRSSKVDLRWKGPTWRTTCAGQKIGSLFDLGSDTKCITLKAARGLGLQGEQVMLAINGVGSITIKVETRSG